MKRLAAGPYGPAAILVGVFALSRVGYYALGVRFDSSPLMGFWQYIDPELLRHDLLESLWFQHAQPPLYNVLLGAVVKLSGAHADPVFHLIYLAAGVVLGLALYGVMVRLGVGRLLGLALTAAFVVSVPTVLYENWLYVDYLVAGGLVTAALLLHRFAEEHRMRDASIAFGTLAAIVLSRTLFHLGWLVLIVALVYVLQKGHRRTVLVAACLPVLLCTAFYAKNLVMWGTFSSTTALGLSTYRVSTKQLSVEERRALVRDGTLSRYALLNPYGLALSARAVYEREGRRGVELLDRRVKSTGAPNFDHAAQPAIFDRYQEDAMWVLRHRPGAVRGAVESAVLIYLRPTNDYPLFTERNLHSVGGLTRVLDRVTAGQLKDSRYAPPEGIIGEVRGPLPRLSEVAWFVVLGYLVAIAFGLAQLVSARRRDGPLGARALLVGYILLNIAYVSVVGTALESGENNRFRFLIDPLALALTGAFVAQIGARARRRAYAARCAP